MARSARPPRPACMRRSRSRAPSNEARRLTALLLTHGRRSIAVAVVLTLLAATCAYAATPAGRGHWRVAARTIQQRLAERPPHSGVQPKPKASGAFHTPKPKPTATASPSVSPSPTATPEPAPSATPETTPAPTPSAATPTPAPSAGPTQTAVSIATYGALPDDGVDDTAAVRDALAANAAVFVPAGTYELGSLVIPAGKTVTGAGMDQSWLRGDLSAGGNAITLRDLKVGKPGNNFEQAATTDHFLAERVRFTGGGEWPEPGGAPGPESHVVWFNYQGGDDIRFVSCYFERNRTSVSDILQFMDKGGIDGDSYTNILVKDCHFERSSFMALEIAQRPPVDPATGKRYANVRGYSITVTGCTFEGADSQVLSFDSNYTTGGPYNHAEFSYNTVGAGGQDPTMPYPHGIEVNNGTEGWVHHNAVAGSRGVMVNADSPAKGDASQVWEDNVFDQTKGIAAAGDAVALVADNLIFRRNTVVFTRAGGNIFYVTGDDVQVAGNKALRLEPGTIAYLASASGVTFDANTLTGESGRVYVRDGSSLTARDNVFHTGLANPYSVASGCSLARSGDVYQ